MRYIRYVFWAALAVILITVSLANRSNVLVRLVPEEFAGVAPFAASIEMPLFLVILVAIAAGVLIGYVLEWLREHKHRAEAANKGREARRLARENEKLRQEKHEGKDDVLALLDKAS